MGLKEIIAAPMGQLELGGVSYDVHPLNFADIEEFGDEFDAWDALQKSGEKVTNKAYAAHISRLVWAMIRKSKRTREQLVKREFAIDLETVKLMITPENHEEVMQLLANFTKARDELRKQLSTASPS